MKSLITGHEIANTVRMMRTQHKGAFLIVEGGDDAQVYSRAIDKQACRLVVANGKPNAIQALSILERDAVCGVLAIIDCDFCKIQPLSISSDNLILTDAHDVECMLLGSFALEQVLSEYGSEKKLAGKNVRETLLVNCQKIGILRWISCRDKLGLTFDGLSYSKFVSKDTLEVNTASLIRTVVNKSGKHSLNHNALSEAIEKEVDAHELWDICCGHDLVQLLSIALVKLFGSCKHSDVMPEQVARSLRLAYERSYFSSTRIYSSIKEWEASNSPYRVLSA